MAETADVVIVGGGIVGSSIAFHLAEDGCKDVLVVERESHQGLGSTGKSMGGVRVQFSTEPNIRMSLYSIPCFRDFEELTGHPCGYKAHGYLFVATRPEHLEALRRNRRLQVRLGARNVELVQPEEILKILPQLRGDDILGGAFCPTDGFVDPHLAMTGFMTRAIECGARLWTGAEVTGIRLDRRGVSSVETSSGPVATRAVVVAAGVWAPEVARLAGIDLPVVPLRRMLVPTEPFPDLPPRLPMIVDMGTGFHFRPEGRGLLLAWADPEETPGFKSAFDPAFIEKVLAQAAARVPAFAELPVNPKRAWAGLYEVTPDHHAVLGAAPGVAGLFLANGFSGHGVMHSPATGRILADLVLRGCTGLLDIQPLGLERFAAGRLLQEASVL